MSVEIYYRQYHTITDVCLKRIGIDDYDKLKNKTQRFAWDVNKTTLLLVRGSQIQKSADLP